MSAFDSEHAQCTGYAAPKAESEQVLGCEPIPSPNSRVKLQLDRYLVTHAPTKLQNDQYLHRPPSSPTLVDCFNFTLPSTYNSKSTIADLTAQTTPQTIFASNHGAALGGLVILPTQHLATERFRPITPTADV
jgi:hypothetical protein